MQLLDCLIIWLSIFTVEPEYAYAKRDDEYVLRGPEFSASAEEYIEGDTFDKNIMALAKRRINDAFIIDAVRKEKLGWNEFIEKSRNLAATLQELRCSSGCIVGIISENRVEYPIVYLGTWLSGAILNNFDILSNNDELTRLFGITKPRIIFGPVEHCNRLRPACPQCTFIVFEPDSGTNALQFSSATQNVKKALEPAQIHPDDTAFIMYSSGTTGLPKAIQLSHKGLVYLNKLFKERAMPKNEGGVMVSDRGFCHGMGLVIFLHAVVRNQTLVVMPKAEEKNHRQEMLLQLIEEYRVNMIITVPSTVEFIMKAEEAKGYTLPSLEYIVSSASLLRPDLERDIKKRLPNLKGVIQWYGSTESMLNTTKDVDNPKLGSVGSLNPLMEMKVVDLKTKESLGSHKRGEIWIRGPTITKGYYGNLEITALAIDQDGWYHSGDIAYYDDDGDFFLVGRLKEVIRYKSYPVVPEEIEGLLQQHPGVRECAAIGIPHELDTEHPRAYVVKNSGVRVIEDDLIKFVKDRASPYAHLRGGVEFVDELPKTTTGKIMRRKLLDMWNEKYCNEPGTKSQSQKSSKEKDMSRKI